MSDPRRYIAFAGYTRIATGTLPEVAWEARVFLDAGEPGQAAPLSVFDASTSAPVDLDLRGTPEMVASRAAELEAILVSGEEAEGGDGPGPRRQGPGRPKLGVVGREVTLLPRHWDWLNAQPGGASATLRRLVDAARKETAGTQQIRETQDVTHRFLYALAGDLPGFEEVSRALYAWDLSRFEDLMGEWPPDVKGHAMELVRSCAGKDSESRSAGQEAEFQSAGQEAEFQSAGREPGSQSAAQEPEAQSGGQEPGPAENVS